MRQFHEIDLNATSAYYVQENSEICSVRITLVAVLLRVLLTLLFVFRIIIDDLFLIN